MTLLLHRLLHTAAGRFPDRPAIVDGDRTITYAELGARAARLARLLRELGIGVGDRVGLYLDKSAESIIGLYGVLGCGAAYVPLDPLAPVSRLGFIAADCGLTCLVTGREKAASWSKLIASGTPLETLVLLNASNEELQAASAGQPGTRVVGGEALKAQSAEPLQSSTSPDDLAYVLYTSGSTGEPKGVMLSHRNGRAFVDWAAAEFELGCEDRLSSHAPLHFDLSVFDVFAAASAGAAVVLVPPAASLFPIELARFIEREQISVWYSVPSILTLLAERGGLEIGGLQRLRTVLFAGEVFPTKYLARLMGLLAHARFCNLYGPTETNVCTWYDVRRLPADHAETIPIGRPIPSVQACVIGDDGAVVAAPGETGELYIGGPTVMQGYWGDPERTERSLVADPSGGDAPGRWYKTGDLVRLDGNGDLRFLGRRDAQVKCRGYRIELGDVEAALLAHERVVECAVLAVPDELVGNRLAAVVVCDGELPDRDLARFCATRLPAYMVPETFARRKALPKTSTGKADRRLLGAELAGGGGGRARGTAVPGSSRGEDEDLRTTWNREWARPGFAPRWGITAIPAEVREVVDDGWFPAGGSVLDVGCGSGEIAAWLAGQGYAAVGADFAASAIERAKREHAGSRRVTFHVADICLEVPPPGRFDAVIDRGCLHGVPPDARVDYVRQLESALQSGARFLLLHRVGHGHSRDEVVGDVRELCAASLEIIRVADTLMACDAATGIEMTGVAMWMTRR